MLSTLSYHLNVIQFAVVESALYDDYGVGHVVRECVYRSALILGVAKK